MVKNEMKTLNVISGILKVVEEFFYLALKWLSAKN